MIITNNFDGGTNTTGMTTGNTGGASGTPFTAVEATMTFSSLQAQSAPLSAKHPATASGYGRWAISGTDRTFQVSMHVYAEIAADEDYILLRTQGSTSVGTSHGIIMLNGANQLRFRSHANSENVWTASAEFPLDQWIRIELLMDIGVANNDGQVRIAYFPAGSNTAIEDSGWLTGKNLRGDTATIGQVYVGKAGTTTASMSTYTDDVEILTGEDYLGIFRGAEEVPETPSPAWIWTGTEYAPVETWMWSGSDYVAVDRGL